MKKWIGLFCATMVCGAATTKFWEQASQADFEKGTLKNIALRSDGRLTLAPQSKELYDAMANYLWAVVEDSKGNVYVGGSGQDSKSKLTRIDKSGKATVVVELSGLEIHALAVDKQDRVYAATSPDGKVYRVDGSGKSSVFYDPKAKYIWALAFDQQGNLIVATGDKGEVHKVTPGGAGTVLLATEEAHARSLAVDTQGNIYVGSEPGGLIFRISPQGQAFVLYQSSRREITAMAVSPEGVLYAAGVGNKQGGSGPAIVAPPPPPLPAPPSAGAAAARGPASATVSPSPLASMGSAVQGGSEVIRIESDGYARSLWNHGSEIVYALAFDQQGHPLIGTGNKGNVYRLDTDLLSTLLLNAAPTQITGLTTSRSGKIFAVTGNVGKVFEIGPGVEKQGTFESEAFDAGFFTYWGRLRSTFSPGTGVKIETRSGNLENPARNWSPWAPVAIAKDAGRITSPPARFLQYRLTLTAANSDASPYVSSLDVAYMPKNVAPVIEIIDLTPPNYKFASSAALILPISSPTSLTLPTLTRTTTRSTGGGGSGSSSDQPATSMSYARGFVGARWLARDPNGDALVSKLEIRGLSETTWKVLKDEIRERQYTWDSTSFADGEYVLRLTVSDSPGNPPGSALTTTLESDPLLIDNTPPRVLNLAVTRTASGLEAKWRVADAFSTIDKCEYSLDGGEWKVIEPTTRLTDSPEHDYALMLPGVSPGEHTIAVRVADDYENLGTEKATIR
ncbi:MAG: hypothetical protein IT168_00965 [Bryobacterales bacterium]|nr:hypothetical protein [Bryobacterales bacterium]